MSKPLTDDAGEEIVRARVDQRLKQDSQKILETLGVSISDVLRETLVRLVEKKKLPFPVRTRKGVVSPEIRDRLIDRNLVELHASRWAETTAQLETSIATEKAKTRPDRGRIEQLEHQLDEHYANRHKPETSRAALQGAQAAKRGARR